MERQREERVKMIYVDEQEPIGGQSFADSLKLNLMLIHSFHWCYMEVNFGQLVEVLNIRMVNILFSWLGFSK